MCGGGGGGGGHLCCSGGGGAAGRGCGCFKRPALPASRTLGRQVLTDAPVLVLSYNGTAATLSDMAKKTAIICSEVLLDLMNFTGGLPPGIALIQPHWLTGRKTSPYWLTNSHPGKARLKTAAWFAGHSGIQVSSPVRAQWFCWRAENSAI